MPAKAQVIPDSSVGTVNNSGTILGGTTTTNGAQQNLFHSFQEFSLPLQTDTVTFIAPITIENIITRVTGGNQSNINGILQVAAPQGATFVPNTTSNLFLINPAGIIFGQNAQLRVGGAFVASTAQQLTFSNGFAFDVASMNAPPLMTVSAPIGLQMGTGSITVNGPGHNLAKLNLANPTQGASGGIAPHVQQGATPGLQVFPGRTLALIGNGVHFKRGVVNANSGHVEIGSVAAGNSVGLSAGLTPGSVVANYDQVQDFRAITFSNRSLVNVSGVPTTFPLLPPNQVFTTQQGSLQMVGQDISLTGTSMLLGQTGVAATQAGGNIRVNAAGTLLLSGSEAASSLRSGIFSETVGPVASASSGAIDVQAGQLQIREGAAIIGLTFSAANTGKISVQPTNQLSISGFNAQNPLITSTISTASASSGRSGDIDVRNASSILLSSGGSVSSLTFAQGQSGNIFIDAKDIHLTDRIAASDVPSSISASNFGPGIAGDVNITTERLSIQNQAIVAASSISDGPAGNIRITATERIDISEPTTGEPTTLRFSSRAINSAVFFPTPLERRLFGLGTAVPRGNAGNLTITTPTLAMNGPAAISVENQGLGEGGDVQITSNAIHLRDGSQIAALTNAGNGGNINLQVRDSLILRTGSGLTVRSGGTGNGGNIDLAARAIIALENSDITADAVRGRGGNINITSQTILGTAFRDRLTDESDITASSEFGVNGTVEINTPTVDATSGTVTLSTAVVDADQQVASGCANNTQGNNFIASGRGGLPLSPQNGLAFQRLWQDVRPVATSPLPTDTGNPVTAAPSSNIETEAVVEAISWQRDSSGEVQLVAGNGLPQTAGHCLETAG